jgi:hypothetical protein
MPELIQSQVSTAKGLGNHPNDAVFRKEEGSEDVETEKLSA